MHCCFAPQCQRLRVVVTCVPPCAPIPGEGPDLIVVGINAPPRTPITPGLPFGVTLGGAPNAYQAFSPLPSAVIARLGSRVGASATSLVFDFGPGTSSFGPGLKYKTATGRVVVTGAHGAAQASVGFVYNWCSAAVSACGLAQFTITGTTTKGLVLVPIDTVTYLSTDPCVESIVLFNVQQYCDGPVDSTPPTIFPTAIHTDGPIRAADIASLLACGSVG
jgi:hypothetical protein